MGFLRKPENRENRGGKPGTGTVFPWFQLLFFAIVGNRRLAQALGNRGKPGQAPGFPVLFPPWCDYAPRAATMTITLGR